MCTNARGIGLNHHKCEAFKANVLQIFYYSQEFKWPFLDAQYFLKMQYQSDIVNLVDLVNPILRIKIFVTTKASTKSNSH